MKEIKQTTTITPKTDLYNKGLCFTKGKQYTVNRRITTTASLLELSAVNDQGQQHIIGSWWREFEIVK